MILVPTHSGAFRPTSLLLFFACQGYNALVFSAVWSAFNPRWVGT